MQEILDAGILVPGDFIIENLTGGGQNRYNWDGSMASPPAPATLPEPEDGDVIGGEAGMADMVATNSSVTLPGAEVAPGVTSDGNLAGGSGGRKVGATKYLIDSRWR